MKHKVLKYEIYGGSEVQITMHRPIKFLHAGEQNRRLFIWALVDSEIEVGVGVAVVGTGYPLNDKIVFESDFLNTVQTESGLVWHVFVEKGVY